MQDFEGKVAVITGGASGIGFGMAERFAAAGMTVVLADINEDALPEAESRLAERGAFVGFDRLGGGPEADGHKVPMVQALIDAGHLENVLLASDFVEWDRP